MPRVKNLKDVSPERKREIKEFFFDNHTRRETADKFTMTLQQVDIIAKDPKIPACNGVHQLLQTWGPPV